MNCLIGNTPLIKINYRYLGQIKSIYTKVEFYNLTGSIKDRIANDIILNAYQKGTLQKGMPIIEATSGNTGISFAALGAYYKHPVIIFMPDWVSKERKALIEMYGAKVVLVSKEEGGFQECIKRADYFAKLKNGFRPNQFSNYDNVISHYRTTAKEMEKQMPTKISAFISGIGTGGTLMGVANYLKEQNPNTIIVAIEPKEAPMLTSGKVESDHQIEGIGDDFIPEIVNRNIIDKVYLIHDEDAINMSRLLASKLGLGVGISSGANILGAILCNEEVEGNVITVLPDDNKKYLSTNLSKTINLDNRFLSNQIELIDYEVIA